MFKILLPKNISFFTGCNISYNIGLSLYVMISVFCHLESGRFMIKRFLRVSLVLTSSNRLVRTVNISEGISMSFSFPTSLLFSTYRV